MTLKLGLNMNTHFNVTSSSTQLIIPKICINHRCCILVAQSAKLILGAHSHLEGMPQGSPLAQTCAVLPMLFLDCVCYVDDCSGRAKRYCDKK